MVLSLTINLPGARGFKSALRPLLLLFFAATTVPAGEVSFTNLLAQGEQAGQRGDVTGAMKFYAAADRQSSTNCAALCMLTKHYCDLMHGIDSPDLQKSLAGLALAAASRAEQVDPKSATAHLCVAVCYVKNFPYAANATKVRWSKAIKAECETAIALDPKQDVGYYLLGRWHVGVVNMNFFVKGLVSLVYGGLPQASNAEAERNFHKAIELAPNRIIHHVELAKVYLSTGEKNLALPELEKCRQLKPVDRDDQDAQAEADKLLISLR